MKKKIVSITLLISVLLIGCGAKKNEQAVSDELIDKFLAGEIAADGNGLYGNDAFYISELQMDEEEWDSYSVGDRLDLDNDGVNEQILSGPYGGMYLDASDNKVKVFASGEGTASNLLYISYDNEFWLVHSDTTHGGRLYYRLEKYSGADTVVDRVILEWHDSAEGETKAYFYNDNEITESEFNELYQKYLGKNE